MGAVVIRFIVLGSAALFTLATTAHAADPAGKPASTIEFWSGPYAGVHAGYGSGRARDVDASGPDSYRDIDGWLGGVQIGLNTRMNGLVLGAEGDIAATGIGFSDVGQGFSLDGNLDWLATIRGRVGFIPTERVLVYGTAGVAFAGFDLDLNGGGQLFGGNGTYTGWALGAGVETMVTDKLSLKAEYLYNDFGSDSYNLPDPVNIALRVHTFRIGANFQF